MQRTNRATKWALALALSGTFLVVIVVGLLLFTRLGSVFGIGPAAMDSMGVVTQVKKLDQLVTVKYSIQRIVGLKEEHQPVGEESILLMVEGQVLAGVDLSSITPGDIQIAVGRRASVTIPRAKVMHVFLDEHKVKVWDRRITWWTPWIAPDPDLEHRARLTALDDIKAAAIEMGILEDAQRNAQSAIHAFLLTSKLDATVTAR
ncbi:MAG: DUF4230 domain-containing protein [Bryobacteraceae bacterium]